MQSLRNESTQAFFVNLTLNIMAVTILEALENANMNLDGLKPIQLLRVKKVLL